MKEECKLCSASGWCGAAAPTDFSISSLMRPAAPAPSQRALLMQLLKLGDYPPSPPLHHAAAAGKPTPCTLCDPLATVWPHGRRWAAYTGIKKCNKEDEDTMTLESGHMFYHQEGDQLSQGGVGFLVNKTLVNNVVEISSVSNRVAYLPST
ncbi:unnamed protein product [Plutella xylostella]|uniref:(diamondback moth) hypothetical protein n=1 Tax=Plutella xylostella TaxID=51655 RepID=A0A8S4DLF5_PLUXY|nr:unnamed protein product [Plutella xylostella]